MDSILSVRINEEVKEKFIKLAEEQGVNNKEFLDLIIKNYELSKASEDVDFVKNDIDELQAIVKRIIDIYINIIDKNKIRTTEVINNFNLSLGEEKEKTNSFNMEIAACKKEIGEFKNENKELKNENKELQVSLSKEKEAIKESREMNSILKEKLNDFNRYKEENKNLKADYTNTKERLNDSEKKLQEIYQNFDKCSSENELLKNKIEEIVKNTEIQMNELINNHQTQLKIMESEMSLSWQKELLQKEQGLREEIWSLKSKYDERISTLIKEKEELLLKISTLQNK